jgi:hypothetical protein
VTPVTVNPAAAFIGAVFCLIATCGMRVQARIHHRKDRRK